jgi:hypothetical protein
MPPDSEPGGGLGDDGDEGATAVRYPEYLMPIAGETPTPSDIRFAELREEICLGYAYNTARAYWGDLDDIYHWSVHRGFDILALTDRQFRQYVALLRRRKYSENTIRRRKVAYGRLRRLAQGDGTRL